MSVARCQREVSSREFAEWNAAGKLEPFGSQVYMLALVAMAAGHWKKTPKVKDVLKMAGYDMSLPQQKPGANTLRQKVRMAFASIGAKLKKKT